LRRALLRCDFLFAGRIILEYTDKLELLFPVSDGSREREKTCIYIRNGVIKNAAGYWVIAVEITCPKNRGIVYPVATINIEYPSDVPFTGRDIIRMTENRLIETDTQYPFELQSSQRAPIS